ncbi:MAG: nucleotide exchange factor GrpE [Verrucomicrobiota bacterium]|nr:nucleotide exchange factor GrpE [Verrucomicrobiota bacterium]
MKKKKESAGEVAQELESTPEMTVLEKRLAEKAALETDEESTENPVNLVEAQEKIDELNARILRLTADYDNFRKRALRDKDDVRQYANQDLLEKLLPVLDNFEMAISAVKDADPSIKDGVQMIYDQLFNVLKDSGMEPIDAIGMQFDPNFHEAISQEESVEFEEGKVIQQVQRGFRLQDRLVRAARVVVAKAPEEVTEG